MKDTRDRNGVARPYSDMDFAYNVADLTGGSHTITAIDITDPKTGITKRKYNSSIPKDLYDSTGRISYG